MVVAHNLSAMNTNNKRRAASSKLAKSLQKLSSGYRINSAADDAAGLSVSEKMRAQIAGIDQAIDNAQDGISYIQTAEGALTEIQNILQRGRSLSEQSANGSYDDPVDRNMIQTEIDQLNEEIDHIAMTDFNGKYVFDTTGATPPDAFGNALKNAGGTPISGALVTSVLADGSSETFVIKYDAISGIDTGKNKGFTEAALTNYVNDLKTTYIPKMLGGIVKALPTTSKPTVDGMTIGFKFEYLDNSTLAYVANSYGTSSQKMNLTINLKYLTETDGKINMTPDMNTTIAHEMTHAVMNDTVTAGMVGKDVDKFPLWFVEGMAQSIGGAMDYCSDILPYKVGQNDANWTEQQILNQLGISQPSDSDIGAWLKKLTTNSSDSLMPYKQGYIATMYLGWLMGGKGNVTQQTIAKGLDKTLAEIAGGKSLQDVIKGVGFGSLKDFQNKIGDPASVDFTKKLIEASDAYRELTMIKTDGGGYTIQAAGTASGGAASIISPNGLGGTKDSLLNIPVKSDYFELDPDNEYGKDLVGDLNVDKDKIFEGGGATKPGNGYIHGDPDPVDPDNPDPVDPDNPDPVDPDNPDPVDPDNPDPVDPDNPDPVDPDNPDPVDPDNPDPVDPDNPDPVDPDNPDPVDPDNPDPVDPDKPNNPDTPGGGTGNAGNGIGLTNNQSLILQVGARTKDAVKFTFKYESDSIGTLKCDLNCTAKGLGLDKLSAATQEEANSAIDRYDWAINKVSLMRATFGAVQNRLEHKIDNLSVSNENLTSAESGIRDADIAKELMEYTKNQIILNASQSLLAQANSLPQGILDLLNSQ